MKKENSGSKRPGDSRSPKKIDDISNRDPDRLIHELQVHQIELEMQNDNLRMAQEETLEALAKYSDLYDFAPDMYSSVDAETGLIRQCNQTLANNLGYSKKEIIGRKIFELYHPNSMETAKRTFHTFRETGEVRDTELQLKRKDGSTIDVSLNVSSVRDKNGKTLYSRSSWRDITRRKQAEEALQKAYDEMERQVEERTKELSKINEGLRHEISVRKKAEKALRDREMELKTKTINLEEVNAALKVLLKQRDEDRTEFDEKVLLNVNRLIKPYFRPRKATRRKAHF